MYSTIRTTVTLTHPTRSSSHYSKKMSKHASFEQFYSIRSKSFSLIDNIKNFSSSQSCFIDKDFIDAIDEKTPKKRMTQFIKRKIPTKIKTEQIEILHNDDPHIDNRRHIKIFSTVFNKQRRKVLSKFESSKQMRQTVFKKLGLKRPTEKPFFDMQRGHIHSFQDRYIKEFQKYNSKQPKNKPLKRVHPLCDIYDRQAKRVINNHSFEQKVKVKVDYEPFGKIDYSARYF